MKIAQISPLWERVPPFRYGGIELVLKLLTDELVKRGHEVTLFASGDSITAANLESVHPKALRLDPNVKEAGVYEYMQFANIHQKSHNFDIIHSHFGFQALWLGSLIKTPIVHTLHGSFTKENERIFQRFSQQHFISISDAQRQPLPDINYVHTVYNGIDTAVYPFKSEPEQPVYLAFVGRISPEKGPVEAIKVAQATGLPLKMAGKVDITDELFYREQVEPLIDGEQIQYLGEVSHEEKVKLLGGAIATLFPINWREPFGLVMIESMAAGTPVVAMGLGSVPEVIVHGETGFVCHSLAEMIDLVPRATKLDRQACREHVVSRFSVESMVDEYERAYAMILS
jgi:glycosyltransferase involved in cell wall biosynthesis